MRLVASFKKKFSGNQITVAKTVTEDMLVLAQKTAQAFSSLVSLPLTKKSSLLQVGDNYSERSGSSLEFHDYREYSPGDDPSRIDWRAFARTDRYLLKTFQTETSPRIDIFLDFSRSMLFHPGKALRLMELVFLLTELAENDSASLKIHYFDQIGNQDKPPLSGGRDLPLAILQAINSEPLTSPLSRDTGQILQDMAIKCRAGSYRIVISDLLFLSDPQVLIDSFQAGSGGLLLIAPYSKTESNPDWSGQMKLIDCESGRNREIDVTAEVNQRYSDAWCRHFANWQETCNSRRAILQRVCAEGNFADSFIYPAVKSGCLLL
ncbi:MAG: DUF58 domain-containing protein [bacterium]|nr:DUF58 domain-containing protein [bacterium]